MNNGGGAYEVLARDASKGFDPEECRMGAMAGMVGIVICGICGIWGIICGAAGTRIWVHIIKNTYITQGHRRWAKFLHRLGILRANTRMLGGVRTFVGITKSRKRERQALKL